LSTRKKPEKGQWYVNIFNDMGADWEAIVNARDAEKEVGFVESVVSTRGLILDLCCGTGRHSIILRRKGWNAVGIDLSKNLLAIAKKRMKTAGANLPLVRGDLRYLPFKNEVFNSIINMFTSFGYLPTESEDLKSLLEVNRILRKNGKFLLDLHNRDHIIKFFQERDWAEFEPFYLLEKRSLDLENNKLIGYWTLIEKGTGQIKSIKHEVRSYTLSRIEQLLDEAGLTVKEVYGGYEKQEFNLDANRMILLTEKRASSS